MEIWPGLGIEREAFPTASNIAVAWPGDGQICAATHSVESTGKKGRLQDHFGNGWVSRILGVVCFRRLPIPSWVRQKQIPDQYRAMSEGEPGEDFDDPSVSRTVRSQCPEGAKRIFDLQQAAVA